MADRPAPSDPVAFRALVQRGVVDAPGESWYGPLVSRRVSHRIARRLVARGASPDAVTAAMVACGSLGVALFLLPLGWGWVAGALLLHAWLVLDAVDGEVARGRGLTSARGVFLDAFGHWLVNPGLLAALAWAGPSSGGARWAMAFVGFMAVAWSRAAADLAPLVRAKLAEGSASGRYGRPPGPGRYAAGAVRSPGGESQASPTTRPRARERLGRFRLLTDAASPVAALTLVAVVALATRPGPGGAIPVLDLAPFAPGARPAPAAALAALAWLAFTAAHLGKAAVLAWEGWRSLPGPRGEGGLS